MKKILLTTFSIIGLLSFTGCRQDFEEINNNPNATSSPLPYGLFNSANKEVMDGTRNAFESGRVTLGWVQYSAQTAYTEEDRYQYRLTSSDALWNTYYLSAQDYKQIIDLNTDPATKDAMSAFGPNNNQIAASRIMLAYIFHNLADTFGDVPYYSYGTDDPDFQALDMNNVLKPKFAPQAKIYADILKELKESAAMIDTGSKVFTQGDALFGSGAKLKKFANSLRLRVATRVKGVVPGAEAHISEAIAGGVMTSNADNVGLKYENNMVNPSPFYAAFFVSNRNDFSISDTLVELLKGERGNFGYDPRLQEFAAPAETKIASVRDKTYTSSEDPADYDGQPYGLSSDLAPSQAPYSSPFSSKVLTADYTEIFMEYAEVEFLLSEANGWSDANYRKGVQASMERWGVPAAKIAAYMLTLPAANQANVLTQKYIALFMQPYEAWAEYRRTGFPKTLLFPGQSETLLVPFKGQTTYTFVPLVDGLTDLPNRLYYPAGVQTKNPENYKAAVAAMGPDAMNTKLIWDKN